jgi:hypothetical protein
MQQLNHSIQIPWDLSKTFDISNKMRFSGLALLAAVGFSVETVNAFTNGTLLPSYLCNDPDGYPKSAGTLIPFLQLGTAADNYNQFPPGNATKPIIAFGDNVIVNVTAIAPTARQIVGAFHNGAAQLDANGNPAPKPYEMASNPPVWLAPSTADATTGQVVNNNGYVITPGALHTFVVASHCPAPDQRGYNNANVALDGFFAYAVDTGTGQRVGSWVNVGATFTNWYACNPQGTASASVGIVHNQLASGTSNVLGLTWQAPATIHGLIKFVGAGVSDCAYGPFSVTYNTTTNTTAPSVAIQGLNPNKDTANVGVYTIKTPAADLPQTMGNAAGVPITPNQVVIPPAMTATGYTPGVVAGIAVGGAVAGAIVVGLIMFFIGRSAGRSTTSKAPLLL